MVYQSKMLGATLGMALLYPAVAYGQSSENNTSENLAVPEIVVTAQRRSERLQDVPIAITSLSGEALNKLHMTESLDIARATPNLTVSAIAGSGTQPNFFLRGVGLNDFSLNNSGPIGVYVDEVYLSSWGAQNFLLYDTERVEVLRGPQGTLYGRNTTGGAISFISRAPGDELSGYLYAEGGKFNTYRFEGAVGGPLASGLRARLSMARNYSRGFFKNVDTGHWSNGTDATGVRLIIDADLSPDLTVRLKAHGDFNRTPFSQYEHLGVLDPATGNLCSEPQVQANQCVDALGYKDDTPFYRGHFDREGKVHRDAYGFSGIVKWKAGPIDLVSVTAYEADKGRLEEESDASPNRLLAVTLANDTWTFTQELRLLGGGKVTPWILGAYYLKEAVKLNNTADLFRDLRPIVESMDPIAYPGGFDPDGTALGAPVMFVHSFGTQRTETAAVFGQIEVPLIERVKLTGGLRYTWEKRRFNPSMSLDEPGFSVPLYQDLPLSTSANNLSGRVALDYKMDSNNLLYASVSRGFKSGGFNGGFLFTVAENVPYRPETLTAYEVGFKHSALGGRAHINLASFYYDYSDVQVFTFVNSGGLPLNVLSNASDARIKGIEVEAGFRPIERFDMNFALGLLDAKLTNYTTFGGTDFSGNRLVQSPKVSFSAQASYQIPLGDAGTLQPQVDAVYKSKHYFSTTNSFLTQQSGYWIANAQLGWTNMSKVIEINAFVRNLFDKNYFVNANDLSDLGFVQRITGSPRTYGVSARFNF